MKKVLLFLPLVCFICTVGFSQTDSLDLIKNKWSVARISAGVKFKHYRSASLFNSNQSISLVEVKPRRKNQFDLGYSEKQLIKTSDFGKSAKAIAALNGTFFDVKNGGSVDFIKANGQIINESRVGKDGQRAVHQQSAVFILNGKLGISKFNGDVRWEHTLPGDDVMVTGPLLLLSHEFQPLDTANLFNKTRHPRSGIVITGKNRVLLITVDGRNENAAGMSLFEFSKLMRWIGGRDGINLDGGGSTTLWLNNDSGGAVVNHPSDNKKWDHDGERKVANTILLIDSKKR